MINFAQFQAWRRQYGYVELLVSVVVLILAAQIFPDVALSKAIIPTVGAICLGSACFAISDSQAMLRKNLLVAMVGATAWILAVAANAHPFSSDHFRVAILVYAICYVGFVGIVILRDVFRSPVTANRICGAITIYLLLGVSFSLLHTIIATLDPKAYEFAASADRLHYSLDMDNGSTLGYYSFCTLTTLGYGDIIPVHRVARVFSWLEAIFGQLYLSILVARLVGLYIADEAADRAAGIKEALRPPDFT